jgi:uncharacterized protein YjbI with pentapeptide repeats
MNQAKSADEYQILLQNQHFLTEKTLSIAESSAVSFSLGTSFVNCNFEKVRRLEVIFGSYNFQNCAFNDTRKLTFSVYCFEDCQITDCKVKKPEFENAHLKGVCFWLTYLIYLRS